LDYRAIVSPEREGMARIRAEEREKQREIDRIERQEAEKAEKEAKLKKKEARKINTHTQTNKQTNKQTQMQTTKQTTNKNKQSKPNTQKHTNTNTAATPPPPIEFNFAPLRLQEARFLKQTPILLSEIQENDENENIIVDSLTFEISKPSKLQTSDTLQEEGSENDDVGIDVKKNNHKHKHKCKQTNINKQIQNKIGKFRIKHTNTISKEKVINGQQALSIICTEKIEKERIKAIGKTERQRKKKGRKKNPKGTKRERKRERKRITID